MPSRKVMWSFLSMALLLGATAATAWAQECSQRTLKGEYAAFEQGTVVFMTADLGFPSQLPTPYLYVLTANAKYDGAGHLSGEWEATFAGFPMTGTFSGTYEVTRDCAYSDELVIVPDGGVATPALHHKGFLTGEGTMLEIRYIYTDAGTAISGTAKKL